jgi:hypothetical protein
MSNDVYPAASAASVVRGLAFTVVKRPAFNSIVQGSPSGAEFRLGQMVNPLWRFTLTYEVLFDNKINTNLGAVYTDLQVLMGFFLSHQGQYNDFLFLDPDDNFMGPALVNGVPNTLAQLPVVNDGAGNYYSPVQRNLGGFLEDITDLSPASTITVYANGVLKSSPADYTLNGPGLALPTSSFAGLYLHWVAGAPATPVTAQFNFYFRVRFESDEQDFEKFLNKLWTIGGSEGKQGSGSLKLVTSRLVSQ